MQTLIIRIYRRSQTKPEEVAGVVESAGTDERNAFQSFSGLISALKQMVMHRDDPAEYAAEQDSYSISGKKQAS